MRLFSAHDRPVHLGPYPLERLKRVDTAPAEPPRPDRPQPDTAIHDGLEDTLRFYQELFAQFRDGNIAPQRAPIPEDPLLLVNDLKAAAYFLNYRTYINKSELFIRRDWPDIIFIDR